MPRPLPAPATVAQLGARIVDLGLDHPANAAALAALVRTARANLVDLVNPAALAVLLDPTQPQVARLRAFAVVARSCDGSRHPGASIHHKNLLTA